MNDVYAALESLYGFDYVFIIVEDSNESEVDVVRSNLVAEESKKYFVRVITDNREASFETHSLSNLKSEIENQHFVEINSITHDFVFKNTVSSANSFLETILGSISKEKLPSTLSSFTLSDSFAKYTVYFKSNANSDGKVLTSKFSRRIFSYDFSYDFDDVSYGFSDDVLNPRADEILNNLKKTGNIAKMLKHSQRLKKRPKAIVFSPDVFQDLMNYAFFPSFKDVNILSGNSFFEELFDKQLFGSWTIIDSPKFKDGLSNVRTDFEGTEAKDVYLLNNGKISEPILSWKNHKNFLKNFEPKGNYFTELMFRDILFSNSDNFDFNVDLFNNSDDILYVDQVLGAHTSNSITSDFSVSVLSGFFNGISVKNIILTGRLIKLLKFFKPFNYTLKSGYLVPFVYLDDFSELDIQF